MASRIRNGNQLFSQSWNVVTSDKSMLVLPLLGITCSVAIFGLASAVLRWLGQPGLFEPIKAITTGKFLTLFFYFLVYFATTFETTFFNCALISIVLRRSRNEPASPRLGLSDALSRWWLILQWSLFMATVGMFLRLIEERTWNLGGYVLVWLLNIGFSVAGFLALPVLVAENKGPIDAFKESVHLLRKTWGEQLVGSLRIGIICSAMIMLAILFFLAGIFSLSQAHDDNSKYLITILIMSIAGILFFTGIAFNVAVDAVFRSALYLYAHDGTLVKGFTDEMLKNSLNPAPSGK